MPKEEILAVYGGNLRERAFKVLDCIADSRRAVENEFRQLLGIHRSGGDEEDTTQIDDDLMWIPTLSLLILESGASHLKKAAPNNRTCSSSGM
jgi:hypothetical protein